ncbi:unnamed protein product [Mytilus coruscus]|uniref:IL17D n=1 Tax=Mytilus coruscus TaxID=42192 RepID=A0A6J8BDI9_MYTCO|nr:unnamed protein product [Mytilus coruscus]
MKSTFTIVSRNFIYYTCLFCQLIASSLPVNGDSKLCEEPDNLLEIARRLYENNINLHNSYYMLEPPRNAIEQEYNKYKNLFDKYRSTVRLKMLGRRKCPKFLPTDPKTSTCPIFWELDFDVSRVPNTIFQAKCRCTKCIVRKRDEALSLLMKNYTCCPVYYYERVLRKVGCDSNNVFIYKKVLEPIQVSCTCSPKGLCHKG